MIDQKAVDFDNFWFFGIMQNRENADLEPSNATYSLLLLLINLSNSQALIKNGRFSFGKVRTGKHILLYSLWSLNASPK